MADEMRADAASERRRDELRSTACSVELDSTVEQRLELLWQLLNRLSPLLPKEPKPVTHSEHWRFVL